MCGITAYKGKSKASPILVKGLKILEYRGYDSAGVATAHNGYVSVAKGVGKVSDVSESKGLEKLDGFVGIAHTRWATTGAVTEENAHPHISQNGKLALVQNGVVENYGILKKELRDKGHKFFSETDTEVILRLIEENLKEHDMLDAVRLTGEALHGRNAFVILNSESEEIYAYKQGSPLMIGVGEDGLFLSSDATPFLDYTKTAVFLNDGVVVRLSDKYEVFDMSMNPVSAELETIEWSAEQAQKGNYPHFMIKEIMEQSDTVASAIAQDEQHIRNVSKLISEAFGTYAVGCGTAGKVALTATYIFSEIAKKHINFCIGSEFSSYHTFLKEQSLLLAISQSGETADTLEAIQAMREAKGKVISVVNVMGSSIMRKSDDCIMVQAGPEKSVCSTKATTGQLAIMYLLAYATAGRYSEGVNILKKTADEIKKFLTKEYCDCLKPLAESLKDFESMYVLGRGQNYPIALESAIKIQEVSYVHAEGFAGGELKHGPVALIEKGTPVIVLVANDDTKEDIITNAVEVKARGARVIGIGPEREDVFDEWISVPDLPRTSPIVNIIPVQILAYHLAVAKGTDVDQPRNLAKSVTVK